MAVFASAVAACGAPEFTPRDANEPGTLQLGRASELDSAHYVLEATFDVTGPEPFNLNSAYTVGPIIRSLVPGTYAVTLEPGSRVLKDVAIAQVPVTADLVSDAWQSFEINSGVTTRVVYRFTVDEGTIVF